jgi:peptidoglycan/LPS O-acetylase OafA/YrhL
VSALLFTADRRMAALDGIRGLAILAVFLSHATVDSTTGWLARWFSWGWMGVDLFFVLSGFLITGVLMEAIGQPARVYYGNFYARRFLRLAPALSLFLVVLFYVAPALGRPLTQPEMADLGARQGWYWSYLVNFLVARHQSFDATPAGTAPLWSLSVEEQFYLIWPFLVARAATPRRVRNLSIATILFAMVVRGLAWRFGYGGVPTYVLTFTRADALAWGALLASIVRMSNGEETIRRLQLPLIVVGIALLTIVANVDSAWPSWDGAPMQHVGFPGLAVGCAGLVAFAITRQPRALTWKPLAQVGLYSYSLYLWHSTVLVLLERVTQVHGPLFVPFGAMACAVPVAISWLAVERPTLRLKVRFPMNSRRALRLV